MEEIWMGTEALVPVPLHPKREKKRGFNQALVLARELGRLSGVEVVEKALVKIKNIAPQTSLEEVKERQKNVSGAFDIRAGEKIKGKVEPERCHSIVNSNKKSAPVRRPGALLKIWVYLISSAWRPV
jgi:hypothetical protein